MQTILKTTRSHAKIKEFTAAKPDWKQEAGFAKGCRHFIVHVHGLYTGPVCFCNQNSNKTCCCKQSCRSVFSLAVLDVLLNLALLDAVAMFFFNAKFTA